MKRKQSIKKIGIILNLIDKKAEPVLRYLILHMNSMQSAFEYEFLPVNNDEFLENLLSKKPIDRENTRANSKDFIERYSMNIKEMMLGYNLKGTISDRFVILSQAKFSDNFYTMRHENLSIIALGNWEEIMAPPSIIEFMLTLIVRESVAVVSPSLRGSIHLGTKGCLEDFTSNLEDARYKVLNAFICQHCREALIKDGFPKLADELITILDKKWLGNISESNSPANISKKLGYNLFTTKGFEATKGEKFIGFLQEESTKQIMSLVFNLLLAFLIISLGLK